MTKEEMSIHKGLAEIKMLDKRIPAMIGACTPVGLIRGINGATMLDGTTKEKFVSDAKSDMTAIFDMIARRNAIKKAICAANATTSVTIKSINATVPIAVAIDMKNNSVRYWKTLVEELSEKYNMAVSNVSKDDSVMTQKCDIYMNQVVANLSQDATKDMIDNLRKSYMDSNKLTLVDPIDIQKLLKDIIDMVSRFEAEVDGALSEVNAVTMITVEYETGIKHYTI